MPAVGVEVDDWVDSVKKQAESTPPFSNDWVVTESWLNYDWHIGIGPWVIQYINRTSNLLLVLRISSGPELCNAGWGYPKRERSTCYFGSFYAKSSLLPFYLSLESYWNSFYLKLKKKLTKKLWIKKLFNQYTIDKLI